jgi:hypothetical protein
MLAETPAATSDNVVRWNRDCGDRRLVRSIMSLSEGFEVAAE